jgi:hypothetical protein
MMVIEKSFEKSKGDDDLMPFWDIENLRRTSRQLASKAEVARDIAGSHATERLARRRAAELGASLLRRLFSRSKGRPHALPVEDEVQLERPREHDIGRVERHTNSSARDRGNDRGGIRVGDR